MSSGADGVGDGPLRALEAESEKNVEKYYCTWYAQIVYKYKLLLICAITFFIKSLISSMSIDLSIVFEI